MTLTQMPKVGDKIRYIGDGFNDCVTIGEVYEIYSVDENEAAFVDDDNDVNNKSFISDLYFDEFELVDEPTPVEASPTVIELLANISRRLYEVEESLKPKYYEEDAQDNSQSVFPNTPRFEMSDLNGKLLRIYTNTDVDGIIKSEITVGIDEETGVMYLLNSKSEVLTHD